MQFQEKFLSLSKVYELLEARLRLAATNEAPVTLNDLLADPEITAVRANEKQVVNAIATLKYRGHLTVTKAPGTNNIPANHYVWDVDSPPFVVGIKTGQKANKLSSQPAVIVKADSLQTGAELGKIPRAIAPVKGAKEVELVFGNTLITIGRNEATGRLRLVLEDFD